jgi:acetyltransferase-like isoleucine patch superfamily enzyme|tara:strand:+ start:600 stop:1367 length:768 start_codon:yes stop_codon:yes gene_type:complete
MYHIEEKLQQFLKKTIVSDITLSSDMHLNEHNIRYTDTEYLKGILFEKGIMNNIPSFQDAPNKIFLGAYSSIRANGYMRCNVFMGRHSGIGYRCTIAAGMHNFSGVSINPDTIMAKQGDYTDEELVMLNISRDQTDVKEMNSRPVVIGNDVYLGDGIIVMPGVTIGNGSVVAANAIITKDVEPYTIVGGVNKVIRDRFPDNVKEMLLETKWWNARLDILKTLPVDNVFRFVDEFNNLDDSKWDDIQTLGYNNANN